MKTLRRVLGALGMVLVVLAVGVVLWWAVRPGVDEADVQRTVIATLQREAPASFYVTGTLELTVTEEVTHTEQLFPFLAALVRQAQPSWPALGVGTARATVRVPGRVSYGFDVSQLTPEHIRMQEDGRVAVTLPPLAVHAVEPYLGRLAVQTEAQGWMRFFGNDEAQVEQEALAGLRGAFRQQARVHLQTATQPRVNTARALAKLLRPVLIAAGLPDPQFRFQIGDDLVLEPLPEGSGPRG